MKKRKQFEKSIRGLIVCVINAFISFGSSFCGVVGCDFDLTHFKLSTSIPADNVSAVIFGFTKHMFSQVGEYTNVYFSFPFLSLLQVSSRNIC